MSRIDKINELIEKMEQAPSAACERLIKLFDENSFVELGAFNKSAGVVTGYGTVKGKLVYAYSQEGAVGVEHAKKIDDMYSLALKLGCPVVGFLDSKGIMLDEGLDTLDAYGVLFKNQSEASGIIPQIIVVAGSCIGVAGYSSVLSDFVIMPKENAKMFMSSPATFSGLEGKATTYESLGGAEALGEEGIVHCVCENEDECIAKAQKIIDFMPENNLEMQISDSNDDLNRIDTALDGIVPEDNETFIDVKYIISSIADNNDFLEIQETYAKEMIIGLVALDGITTGVIANNGVMSVDGAKKAGDFINICDAFNIPIVTFTDICGYDKSLEAERNGIMKYSAKLTYAFANATVPKINVIIRNGIGSAYLTMNSKHIGADLVYAWPSAEISLLSRQAATNILNTTTEEYDLAANPYTVGAKGYVDSVIIPSNTRKRILVALESLLTKREVKPARKHSSVEF
ncbi:MAG: acyl-CoA carboxylase subunit beta [Lachnospirales bacterium]